MKDGGSGWRRSEKDLPLWFDIPLPEKEIIMHCIDRRSVANV
jgi:hypothetical protein